MIQIESAIDVQKRAEKMILSPYGFIS